MKGAKIPHKIESRARAQGVEVRQMIVAAINGSPSLEAAAEKLEVSRVALYLWCRKHNVTYKTVKRLVVCDN